MSVFLFVVGALSALGGIVAIAFGLPVKEFSFGNTLILAGATALMGGLILIGLGAAITQLKRIAELLGARPLSRAGRGLEPFDQPGRTTPARVPFPPKRKPEPPRDQPADETAAPLFPMPVPELAHKEEASDAVAPSLHNPDAPLMDDEPEPMPLSPPEPRAPLPEPSRGPASRSGRSFENKPFENKPFESKPFESKPFDAMWPAESREEQDAAPEPMPSRAETIPRAANRSDDAALPEPPAPEVRAVAILKSGKVDGMGYTLFVDGSIEAELPDGTLHFASIGELRAHLEQNS